MHCIGVGSDLHLWELSRLRFKAGLGGFQHSGFGV